MAQQGFRGHCLYQTRRIANPAGCRELSGRIRNPPGISPPEIQKSQKNFAPWRLCVRFSPVSASRRSWRLSDNRIEEKTDQEDARGHYRDEGGDEFGLEHAPQQDHLGQAEGDDAHDEG